LLPQLSWEIENLKFSGAMILKEYGRLDVDGQIQGWIEPEIAIENRRFRGNPDRRQKNRG